MIYEEWHGVFSPKGELYSVEGTELQAQSIAAHLAGAKNKPWPIKSVLIVDPMLKAGIKRMINEIIKEAKKDASS